MKIFARESLSSFAKILGVISPISDKNPNFIDYSLHPNSLSRPKTLQYSQNTQLTLLFAQTIGIFLFFA
jgi:hypothetical protein